MPNRNDREDINYIGEVRLLIENRGCLSRDIHGDVIGMIYLETSAVAQKNLERMKWCGPTQFYKLIDDHFDSLAWRG